jgi:hypothetical protein
MVRWRLFRHFQLKKQNFSARFEWCWNVRKRERRVCKKNFWHILVVKFGMSKSSINRFFKHNQRHYYKAKCVGAELVRGGGMLGWCAGYRTISFLDGEASSFSYRAACSNTHAVYNYRHITALLSSQGHVTCLIMRSPSFLLLMVILSGFLSVSR